MVYGLAHKVCWSVQLITIVLVEVVKTKVNRVIIHE